MTPLSCREHDMLMFFSLLSVVGRLRGQSMPISQSVQSLDTMEKTHHSQLYSNTKVNFW